MQANTEQKGFFASLFDFGFTSLVATRFLKFIYVVGIVLLTLFSLADLVTFARLGRGGIVAGIFIAAVSWLVGVVWMRIIVEFFVVFFRMGSDVRSVAMATNGGPVANPIAPSPPSWSPPRPVAPPPPVQPVPRPPSFCASCGSALTVGAKTCAACNAPV